jgi:hypothetical protein
MVLFIPVLYGVGWLMATVLVPMGLPKSSVSLVGTLLSFLSFLIVMPRWVQRRWQRKDCWVVLGICPSHGQPWNVPLIALVRGLLMATSLLSLVTIPILLNGWGTWRGDWTLITTINALILCLGVGVAEEIIFRAWLWKELNNFTSRFGAVVSQALVFSVVHTRFNLGVTPMLGLLTGLFLLGMTLAMQRHHDDGSLWGCVGMHGGLVGGWFLLTHGLLDLSQASALFVGVPAANPNPLSGLIAITAFSLLLIWRWQSLQSISQTKSKSF